MHALRSIAACGSSGVGAIVLAAVLCTACFGADCTQGLSTQERVARFKQLDQQAEKAMHDRQFAEAVQLYRTAVCLVPDSARGMYGLGMAQAAAQDFRAARESFQTADRLQPTTAMPLIMQVRVNLSLAELDSVKSNLRAVAQRFPNDTEAHDALARLLAENNLLVLAAAEALRSERSKGAGPAAKIQLAGLENTIGAYQDAIENARAVEKDTGFNNAVRASAAGIIGLSYESLSQTAEAVRYLREAIELDPSRRIRISRWPTSSIRCSATARLSKCCGRRSGSSSVDCGFARSWYRSGESRTVSRRRERASRPTQASA